VESASEALVVLAGQGPRRLPEQQQRVPAWPWLSVQESQREARRQAVRLARDLASD